MGNKQDRKKNPFDPIGNPVYFFTKDEGSQKGVSLQGYAKKIENAMEERYERQRQLEEILNSSLYKQSPVKGSKKGGVRPVSAHPLQKR